MTERPGLYLMVVLLLLGQCESDDRLARVERKIDAHQNYVAACEDKDND